MTLRLACLLSVQPLVASHVYVGLLTCQQTLQGADALERATRVKTVIFDKTGTLTKGKPAVTDSCIFLKGKLSTHSRAPAVPFSPLVSLYHWYHVKYFPGQYEDFRGSDTPVSEHWTADVHNAPFCVRTPLPGLLSLMLEMVQAGFHEEEFLHLAAATEASSEHPLGRAVTAHARARLQQRSAAGETIFLTQSSS